MRGSSIFFLPVKREGVSGEDRGKGSTVDAPVRLSPPSGVPSEAVAEILASERCIDVSIGLLLCASKWEPSLARRDHDELLCCKPSLLGIIGALASNGLCLHFVLLS